MLHKRISSALRPAARLCRQRPYSTEPTPPQLAGATVEPPTPPNTHYRITLLRSAIALPKRYKATLVSLGIHRRMQTVYHPHTPDIAGKILRVKELVEVQNVPTRDVRTKAEQRWERQPTRGFEIIRRLRDTKW